MWWWWWESNNTQPTKGEFLTYRESVQSLQKIPGDFRSKEVGDIHGVGARLLLCSPVLSHLEQWKLL